MIIDRGKTKVVADLRIEKLDEVYLRIDCNEGIARELHKDFSFQTKNYHFGHKKKGWDGRLHLFNLRNNNIYVGLLNQILRWAYAKHYTHDWVGFPEPRNQFWHQWVESLGLPKVMNGRPFEVREDQHNLVQQAIELGRSVIISPTGSGKSLIAYLLARHYSEKTLIIVPTINLVNQLWKDFKDYGYDSEELVHRIYDYDGMVPETDKPITITTWHSIADMPPSFFADFRLVIGDEAHGFKAKSLRGIMEKMVNTPHRFAMTATLANQDQEVDELVIEGLFGPQVIGRTTQDLMKEGHLANIEINCIILEYPIKDRRRLRRAKIEDETDFLVSHKTRNNYIKNLALSLKGSTFVLFRLVEKHGLELHRLISTSVPKDRHTWIVYGETDDDIREAARCAANEGDDIVSASYGVFSGGVNVPNLRNAIMATNYKTKIKVMQSIGRTVRKTSTKDTAYIYDIIDDLSIGDWQNFSIRHYLERLKLYYKEFPNMKIRILTVPLEEPGENKHAKGKTLL